MTEQLTFQHILTPQGLLSRQTLHIEQGIIRDIVPASAADGMDGYLAIPGMPNAHSHAFQRALSGYGEAAVGNDSFWSWREAMYRLANSVTPEDCYIIARMAFADMLRGGFTHLAEFHYLHHLPDGTPGPDMAQAVAEAARDVGLPLTLLPVYYQTGGFDKPAQSEQRRFIHKDVESYGGLLEQLKSLDVKLGIAPHSLRAAPIEQIPSLLETASSILGADYPIHMHIAEQTAEVDACLEKHGKRPVELLAATVALNARWNLVHATHITAAEMKAIVDSQARIVICPITEAYLGDGLGPADEFAAAGGQLAIGSDSNCRIDALEELRLLEYGQRLRSRARARFADQSGAGERLWRHTAAAGAAAAGLDNAGQIRAGARADFVTFDAQAAPLLGHGSKTALDALLINGSAADIAAVYVQGKRVIEQGSHRDDETIRRDFDRCVKKLLGAK